MKRATRLGTGMRHVARGLLLVVLVAVGIGTAIDCQPLGSPESLPDCEERAGDLILDGSEVLVISGATYCQQGGIVVRGQAKLVVTDATVRLGKGTSTLWGDWAQIRVLDSGRVEMRRVVLEAGGSSVWVTAGGKAQIELETVRCTALHGLAVEAREESSVRVVNCTLQEFRVADRAQAAVERSKVVWAVDLAFGEGRSVELRGLSPGSTRLLELGPVQGMPFSLAMIDAEIGAWSVHAQFGARVKVADSVVDRIVVQIRNATGTISSLRPGHYVSWCLGKDTSVKCTTDVVLENVTVSGHWALQFSGNVDVSMVDSELGGVGVWDASVNFLLSNVRLGVLSVTRSMGRVSLKKSSIRHGIEFDFVMLEMSGDVAIASNARVILRNSTVRREYSMIVLPPPGAPLPGVALEIITPTGEQVLRVADERGVITHAVTFNDRNHLDRWTVRATDYTPLISARLTLLSSTPILLDLNKYPGTTTLIPYDGLVIDQPGTYTFIGGEFYLDDTDGDGSIIRVGADDVTLVGNGTVLVGGEDHSFATPYHVIGITLHGRRNVVIEGFTIKNYAIGIRSTGYQAYITIRNNRFFDNSRRAVEIKDYEDLPFPPQIERARSHHIAIEDNLVVGNTTIPTRTSFGKLVPCYYRDAEELGASVNCTGIFGLAWYCVRDSVMRGNTVINTTVSALRPDFMHDCVIENNKLENSSLAIWSMAAGPFLRSSNVYRGNEISGSAVGLGAGQNGRENTYENNVLYNNITGLLVLGQITTGLYLGNQGERVVGNTAYDNVFGLRVLVDLLPDSTSFNVYVVENRVFENSLCGILVSRSGHVLLERNDVYRNGDVGIAVGERATTVVRGNTIHENPGWGVALWTTDCVPPQEGVSIPTTFEGIVTLDGNAIWGNGRGDLCGVRPQ